MRELRQAAGLSLSALADESGWNKSHLSHVEQGKEACSPELVEHYELRLGGDGVLLSLYAALQEERQRSDRARRAVLRGKNPPVPEPVAPGPGQRPVDVPIGARDRSLFVRDVTIPDGTVMAPAEPFTKTWEIRNSGEVPWTGRFLTRLGPTAGGGVPSSPRRVTIPDTDPGETVEISVPMKAHRLNGSAEIHWKMTDGRGNLYFPDRYSDGLVLTIVVRA
jgi:hypothetical protein